MAYIEMYMDGLSGNLSGHEARSIAAGRRLQCEYLLDYDIRWSETVGDVICVPVCLWCGHAGDDALYGYCCAERRRQIERYNDARLREWSLKTGLSEKAPLDCFHPDWGTWRALESAAPQLPEPDTIYMLFGSDQLLDWAEFLAVVWELWSNTPLLHQALEVLCFFPFEQPQRLGYEGKWHDAQPWYDKVCQILASGDLKAIRQLFKETETRLECGEHLFPPETRWNLLGR